MKTKMTQEKELLLIDLCGRLPYGVKLQKTKTNEVVQLYSVNLEYQLASSWKYNDNSFKIGDISPIFKYDGTLQLIPYLRSLSSLTDAEFHSLEEYTELQHDQIQRVLWGNKHSTLEFYLNEVPQYCLVKVFDWLNRHHFDYRGLIEQCLALEAPEGMYNDK